MSKALARPTAARARNPLPTSAEDARALNDAAQERAGWIGGLFSRAGRSQAKTATPEGEPGAAGPQPPVAPLAAENWISDLLARASHEPLLAARPWRRAPTARDFAPRSADRRRAAEPAPPPPASATPRAAAPENRGGGRERLAAFRPKAPVFAPKILEKAKAPVPPAPQPLAPVVEIVSAPPAPAPLPPATEVRRPQIDADRLQQILRKLREHSAGVEAAVVIGADGGLIASALAGNMDTPRIAGAAATLRDFSARAAQELARGATREIIVHGAEGYTLLNSVKDGASLLTLVNGNSNLGLIFFDIHEAVAALAAAL